MKRTQGLKVYRCLIHKVQGRIVYVHSKNHKNLGEGEK